MLSDGLPRVEERDCTHELVDVFWDAGQEKVIVRFRSLENTMEQEVEGADVFSISDAGHRRFAIGKYTYDGSVPEHVEDEPHWLPLHSPRVSRCIVVRMGAPDAACETVQ